MKTKTNCVLLNTSKLPSDGSRPVKHGLSRADKCANNACYEVSQVLDFRTNIQGIKLPMYAIKVKAYNKTWFVLSDFDYVRSHDVLLKVDVLYPHTHKMVTEYIHRDTNIGAKLFDYFDQLDLHDYRIDSYKARGKKELLNVPKRVDNTIAVITDESAKKVSPRDRMVQTEYVFKPTGRVNFGKTTDFDAVPHWNLVRSEPNTPNSVDGHVHVAHKKKQNNNPLGSGGGTELTPCYKCSNRHSDYCETCKAHGCIISFSMSERYKELSLYGNMSANDYYKLVSAEDKELARLAAEQAEKEKQEAEQADK